MTFELYKKGAHGIRLNPTEVRVCGVTVSFGDGIAAGLRKVGYCEVYLDRENNRIGFMATENKVTGFSTPERIGSKALYISSKTFAGLLPKGTYEAKKEDDMWVITVPEIAKR